MIMMLAQSPSTHTRDAPRSFICALLIPAAFVTGGAAGSVESGRHLVQMGIGPNAASDLTALAPAPTASVPFTSSTAEEGDLRLVSQVVTNGFTTGALQLFHDGQFGAVCNSGFDNVDATVACRQLGFPAGGFALGSLFPSRDLPPSLQEIQAPFALENLGCTGSEARLLDCPVAESDEEYQTYQGLDYTYSQTASSCEPFASTYAFVACGAGSEPGGPEEGDLRVAPGATSASGAQFGRLEVFASGGWGTVCGGLNTQRPRAFFGFQPPPFTEASADVACQQLGFQEGALTATPAFVSDDLRPVPILVGGAACIGSEDFLADCPGFSIGNNTDDCGHTDDVTLVCFNGPDPAMDGSVRLVGGAAGPGYEYGRLEVFLRGFWSSVCNVDGFTPDSAAVACRALGFGGGASLEFFQPFTATPANVLDANLPFGLAAVDCNGTETSLLDCSSDDGDIGACATVNANVIDATVLACADTAPECGETPPNEEGALRLVGGFGTLCDPLYTGIVEVFHFGEWGALCFDDRQDDELVADVVCRQLGFPHGTPVDPVVSFVDPDDYYGAPPPIIEESELPRGRFWLSEASCRGSEQRLVECDLGAGFITNNRGCGGPDVTRFQAACRQFAVSAALEDVATPGAAEGDVRLVNETAVANWQIGRLEIFFEGAWSQVCRSRFDSPDADVACRQLGYGAGSAAATGAVAPEDLLVYPEVAVTLPVCNGTETSLLECGLDSVPPFGPFNPGIGRTCFDDTGPGLFLACVAEPLPDGVEGAVRLVDTQEKGSVTVGIPQIFHGGAWGSICAFSVDPDVYIPMDYGDPEITDASAAILCRELGFDKGFFESLSSVPANTTLLPPWLNVLGCVGVEPTLASCNNGEFGSVSECGLTQQLVCTSGSGVPKGTARLVGGSSDPGGAWAYGRLEVYDGVVFSGLREGRFNSGLGRNAAIVACRSLGFDAGVEIVAGGSSALPGLSGDALTLGIDDISCAGDESTLADCDIDLRSTSDYTTVPGSNSVALLCSTPSGCSTDSASPAEGDVRLVPLINATSETAPCDAVHQGIVQYFSGGTWQLICNSPSRIEAPSGFDVDAKVICGQLGFPFGTRFDSASIGDSTDGQYDYDYTYYGAPGPTSSLDDVPVFATRVSCTGKEERLDECYFRERDPSLPRSSVDLEAVNCNRFQATRLAVACRRFPIPESNVIRR